MAIQSKVPNDKYREEYDRIFNKWKERHPELDDRHPLEKIPDRPCYRDSPVPLDPPFNTDTGN